MLEFVNKFCVLGETKQNTSYILMCTYNVGVPECKTSTGTSLC